MDYFSDKEQGTKERTSENISPAAWGGIVALINELIRNGAFGNKYPELCPDGAAVIGSDEHLFSLALRAEIAVIDWPLKTEKNRPDAPSWESEPYVPDTIAILDLVQFCYHAVAKPIPRSYHSFFGHSHLSFDEDIGKGEFLSKVNKIFERNGIAFKLNNDGSIDRIVSPIMQELLVAHVSTNNTLLTEMINESKSKFLNPRP